jgi:NADPH:quinone reductase-like Zn-dependent oxidoreductase
MRAVVATEPGGPEVLAIRELPDPVPGEGELVIDMAGTAVNRADTLQRRGQYPPPAGASDVLGIE